MQQGVSQFTTGIVYDRGGTGYSDSVPLPRTAAAVAGELHGLLQVEKIAAPYVLVAHSLGGAYAHRFAQLYPREVAGMVGVDAFHRDWDQFVPAVVSLAASAQIGPDPAQVRQMRPALREMYGELLRDYPQGVREALVDAHVSEEWLRVGVAERGSLVALADELRGGPGLPDVPVVALTVESVDAGPQPPIPEQLMREIQEGMRRMGAALVSAVSHGEHRIVSGVGHNRVCFERPDVVIQAIRDVVVAAGRA
ncbi:alpha/beta fold hydrolase [Nocardia sp. NPDC088792]|uniref:alpha/beta fold hydrolase n=1 Tax=Nocardia sp. NPDC088792 TaxID=3364332 RepID=UPI0037FABBA7